MLKKIIAATHAGAGSNLGLAADTFQEAVAALARGGGAGAADWAGFAPIAPATVPTGAGDAARTDVHPGSSGASFASGTYSGPSGARAYKLFRPAGLVAKAPLVVMLHGCKQDPDDFAAGTRMNSLAEQHGFVALYPEQAPRSNASKCWNWFVPADQHRGRGEPELLAGMTRRVIDSEPIDPGRVYVAGLSAGGSMAAILGREYPDLFAAVGVHSGLPPGAAHDLASAFAAMQNGNPEVVRPAASAPAALPTIVFHGDRDRTVHPGNAERLVEALLGAGAGALERRSEAGSAGPGARRRFTRTAWREPGARDPRVELWIVHGAGHAWSGGSAAGSFTDPRGPDASREFFRFFDAHRRGSAA